MLRLILVRHAKSSWGDAGLADFDRPLAPRGEHAADAMGEVIAARGLTPDRILCSPARRTRETVARLFSGPAMQGRIAFIEALYDSPGDYRAIIAAEGGTAQTLMVVGHNPATHATALVLAGTGEPGLTRDLAVKYPTGAMTVIQFDEADWTAVAPHSGHVSAFIRPRDLE